MSKLKFVKFSPKVGLNDVCDVAHNVLFETIKTNLKDEITGVVMFKFATPTLGRHVVVFDIYHDRADETNRHGVYPVQEKFVTYIEQPPTFVVENLLIAASIFSSYRTSLKLQDTTMDSVEEARTFFDASLEMYREHTRNMSLEVKSKKNRRVFLQSRKCLVDVFEKAMQDGVRQLNVSERINVEAELLRERKEAKKKMEDRHREQLLLLRDSMRNSRLVRDCKLLLNFRVASRTITERVDKELLFVYEGCDLTTAHEATNEISFFSSTINTLQLIETTLDILYTENFTCTVADLMKIMPFFAQMKCRRLVSRCFSFVESNMKQEDMSDIIECHNNLTGIDKAAMHVLIKILSKKIVETNKAILDNVIKVCNNSTALFSLQSLQKKQTRSI